MPELVDVGVGVDSYTSADLARADLERREGLSAVAAVELVDRARGAAGASDGAGGGDDGASARPLVDRRGERRGEGACRGGGGGGGDGDGASARPRVDRRGERRGAGAGAGASAAGARPRDDRRRAPAPANALQPLSMCWPMTDKATVASQIGQRAQPSWSASDASLRDAAGGVSSIVDRSQRLVARFFARLRAAELGVSIFHSLTISVALAWP